VTAEDAARLAAEAAARQRQEQVDALVLRARAAYQSDDAALAQHMLAGELTPQVMGFLADLIEEGQGRHARDRFASQQEWYRFDRSISDRRVMGTAARHATPTPGSRPYKPMLLAEAQAFIRGATLAWLAHVASRAKEPPRRPAAPHE
jgi:hypothetical protein